MTTKFKKGDIVLYRPVLSCPQFGAMVASDPYRSSGGDLVCDLVGLGKAYFDLYSLPETPEVHRLALVERLELAPTVFCSSRKWITQELFEGDFLVGYVMAGQIYWSDVEGQFTDIGWRYQAFDARGYTRGAGPADSYESARAAVEGLCK